MRIRQCATAGASPGIDLAQTWAKDCPRQVYDSTADEAKSWQMGLTGRHAECGSTTGVLSKLLRSWVEGPKVGEECASPTH